MKPFIIGVAGGSGSGKTTVVKHIIDRIGVDNLVLIQHDSYYRDLAHLSFEERAKQNFDHPSALESELLVRHVEALTKGYSVEMPIYDFKEHVRSEKTETLVPKPVIIVDGILIFFEVRLRNLMHLKLFVDTDADVRLLRRLRRDIIERKRTVENVLDQYERHVRMMHLEFVEPTKRYADIIIPHGGENVAALDMLNALITRKLGDEMNLDSRL
jgi:uridine kinase